MVKMLSSLHPFDVLLPQIRHSSDTSQAAMCRKLTSSASFGRLGRAEVLICFSHQAISQVALSPFWSGPCCAAPTSDPSSVLWVVVVTFKPRHFTLIT